MKKRSAEIMATTESDESNPQGNKLRLLLHTIDGCVPYLTPLLLETHFPPSEDLWIGLAVRDLCVVPFYKEQTKKKKKKTDEKSESNEVEGDTADVPSNTAKVRPAKKPRGYTFAPTTADSWLIPYTRITVPSFDLVKDLAEKQKEPTADVTSSNDKVFVWTPHGRQPITPELYFQSSMGLRSHFTLPLYDMTRVTTSKKRQEKAVMRTQKWFKDFCKKFNSTSKENTTNADNTFWAPIVLSPNTKNTNLSLDHIDSINDDVVRDQLSGITLIGPWRSGIDSKKLRSLGVPNIVLLSTQSLSEILDVASDGLINVIGTDLPTRWTKSKRAFAVNFDWKNKNDDSSTKRPKLNDDDIKSSDRDNNLFPLDTDGCMDFHDTRFKRDQRPILPGCSCMACKGYRFSRSYIHHLICAKEMVADILLFGHNLHHLLQLLRTFSNLKNEEAQALKEYIRGQLER